MKNNETEYAQVRVHGMILESLAELIPTDVIALNELVKNAYDAEATQIKIEWNKLQSQLIICDNGIGMSRGNIENLFNYGYSTKKYGRPFKLADNKEIRYTQGSKGLGNLAAFHFGNHVYWRTSDGVKGWEFESSIDEFKTSSNLGEEKITLRQTNDKTRGTKVIIDLSQDGQKRLSKIMEAKGERDKIANLFRQTQMDLSIFINGVEEKCVRLEDMRHCLTDRQRFYVRSDEKEKKIKMYYLEEEVASLDVPQIDMAQIELELMIYDLKGSTINALPNMYERRQGLAPLMYINHNLYDTEELFDPSRMRRNKSEQSLPNIIGWVDLTCEHKDLKFNADRTRLVQNEYTDLLKKTLNNLCDDIQKEASALKKDYKEKGIYNQGRPRPQSSSQFYAGEIRTQKEIFVRYTNESQLDTRDLIAEACDGAGDPIDKSKIDVYIDGIKNLTGIIESQDKERDISVKFEYRCGHTGKISKEITVQFRNKRKKDSRRKSPLFSFTPSENVDSQYIRSCEVLMQELNKLYEEHIKKREDYLNVLSCSLRAVFELSWKSFREVSYLPEDFIEGLRKKRGSDAFQFIIDYFKNNKKIFDDSTTNIRDGYSTIKNLQLEVVREKYDEANVGVHEASSYYDEGIIEAIAKQACFFYRLVVHFHKKNASTAKLKT